MSDESVETDILFMRGPANHRVDDLWAAFGMTSCGSTWVIDHRDESSGGVQWYSIPAFRGYDQCPEGVIEAARADGMVVEVVAEHDPERLAGDPRGRNAPPHVWEMLARDLRPDDMELDIWPRSDEHFLRARTDRGKDWLTRRFPDATKNRSTAPDGTEEFGRFAGVSDDAWEDVVEEAERDGLFVHVVRLTG